ncbi:MAG: hypothetical protein ACOC2F_00360 [Bacteroidota bacterium]
MIVKRGNEYILYSRDGTKILGRFKSKKAVLKREKQELEDGEIQTVWTFNYDNMVEKWNRFREYMKEETCWLNNGKVYVSEIDNNKNKPPQAGWKEIVFEGVQKAEEQEAEEWVPVTNAEDVYKMGEVVIKDGRKYMSNHPANSWEPGILEWLNLWIDIAPVDPEAPEEKPPQWVSEDYYKYSVGYQVYDSGKVWEAINETHTWIQPALTGDGSLSWKFVKDWKE